MIGALFNALAGRSDFGTTGRAIDASAGQRAIGMQLDRAGRQNAALQYSLAAGARGANQGMAIREAQRRAQLGVGQAAESAAIASQQLQQGVAEANQRASLQADQINQEVSLANAKNLQPLAMAGAAAAGGALSDERAKMPLGQPGYQPDELRLLEAGRYASATAMPGDDGRRVTWIASPPPEPATPSNFEFAPRVTTPVLTMGGPQRPATRPAAPPPASRNAGQAFSGALTAYLSDERSKQKIMELEAANRGLSKMLERTRPAGAPPQMGRLPVPQVPAVAPQPQTRQGEMQLAVERGQVFEPRSALEAEQYGKRWMENKRLEAMGDADRVGRFRQELAQASAARDLEQTQYQKPMEVPYYEPAVTSDYRSKMLSDERAKDVTSYLRPVRPVAYEYRPEFQGAPGADSGPQVGLLAQDLERSPIGATVVQQGGDGMKRVQVPQLLMLNTAADAEQQRQIDELKRRKRRG